MEICTDSDSYGIETNRYVAVDPQLFKRLLNNHGFPVETIIQQLQLDGFLTKGDGNNLFPQIKLPSGKLIRMAKIEKFNLE